MRYLSHAPALLLLIALALGVSACGEEAPPSGVQVEDFRLVRESDGTQIVRGELYNPSDRSITGAQIEVALYEGEADVSQPAETMQVQVRNIGPGERVPFRQEVDTGRYLSGARVENVILLR